MSQLTAGFPASTLKEGDRQWRYSMFPFEKPIESIQESDLRSLVDDHVPEGKTIDYKEALPDNSDKCKKEFLADVSSFANASGGYLIFGIREESGLPAEICGLETKNPDSERLRLESIIRDGMEPRISGIGIKVVPLQTSKVVIIISVPRSWALPHRVKFKEHLHFYSRNSAGKYPLDVSEVRALFSISETTADRLRTFRMERLGKIVADEGPVPLDNGIKTVLHLIPFSAFDPGRRIDASSMAKHQAELGPIAARGWSHRYNVEGFLTYCQYPESQAIHSYVQVFRNGAIEGAVAGLLTGKEERILELNRVFESELLTSLPGYLSVQRGLGVDPPILIGLSLLDLRGHSIAAFNLQYHFREKPYPIRSDSIIWPEALIETYECNVAEVMKPMFDALWNAAGYQGSAFYDEGGNRKG
jgi:hypothetical protein